MDVFRLFTFRKQNKVDIMRNDIIEVFNPPVSLVDPHHPLGTIKIERPKRIPDQVTGFIFFIRCHGIFKVKDDPIRIMDARIDHQAGRIPGRYRRENRFLSLVVVYPFSFNIAGRNSLPASAFYLRQPRYGLKSPMAGPRNLQLSAKHDRSKKLQDIVGQLCDGISETSRRLCCQAGCRCLLFLQFQGDKTIRPDGLAFVSCSYDLSHVSV